MKFEYEKDEDKGECVAYSHVMDGCGSDTESLSIKVSDGKVLTFYYSGTVKTQPCYEQNLGVDITRKFYKGDKITITF